MAVEIQQNDFDQSSHGTTHSDLKEAEKDVVQTNLTDIEAEAYIDGEAETDKKTIPLYRAEKTELVPVEAFKWNVEGDQSPCEILLKISLDVKSFKILRAEVWLMRRV